MICPTCHALRFRDYWRPSQWKNWTVVTDQFEQCKFCDKARGLAWWELLEKNACGRVAVTIQPPPPPPPPLAADIINCEWFMDLHSWFRDVGFRCTAFAELVNRWMSMKRADRKFLSYFGAINHTEGTPIHYSCVLLGKQYFDPSNYIYAIAFVLLYGCPNFEELRPGGERLNDESKGDVLEGLLGYVWTLEVQALQGIVDEENLCKARQFSEIVNFVVDRLYRLFSLYPELDRNGLVLALRSTLAVAMSLPVVAAVNDFLSCGAKGKLLGDRGVTVEGNKICGNKICVHF